MDYKKMYDAIDYDKFCLICEHIKHELWFKTIYDDLTITSDVPINLEDFEDDLEDFEDDLEDFEIIDGDIDDNDLGEKSCDFEPSSNVVIDESNINMIVNKVSQNVQQYMKGVHDSTINKDIQDIKTLFAKKDDSSYSKGRDAEDIINNELDGRWNYIRTTNKPHQGDFIISIHIMEKIYKILVEVKNYKNVIPSSEYDKFINDINTTKCDAGIYYAFNGIVSGVDKQESFLLTHGGIEQVPVLKIQNCRENIIAISIEILRAVIVSTSNTSSILSDVDQVKHYTHAAIQQLNGLYNVQQYFNDMYLSMTNHMAKAQLELSQSIIQLKINLECIIGNIKAETIEWVHTSVDEVKTSIDTRWKCNKPLIRKEVLSIVETICLTLESITGELKARYTSSIIKLGDYIELKLLVQEQLFSIDISELSTDDRIAIFTKAVEKQGITIKDNMIIISLRKSNSMMITSTIKLVVAK